jgi:hypothetical protein
VETCGPVTGCLGSKRCRPSLFLPGLHGADRNACECIKAPRVGHSAKVFIRPSRRLSILKLADIAPRPRQKKRLNDLLESWTLRLDYAWRKYWISSYSE